MAGLSRLFLNLPLRLPWRLLQKARNRILRVIRVMAALRGPLELTRSWLGLLRLLALGLPLPL
ncbi:hypothetical protein GCM10010435_64690 [Winogradskya consettensis]|uniref:Uncharacterized protein n=1 Tax=Winogradskya consettensis TaxID=113560 RepID=A0A919SIC6_9ACTN|nr:hypothetical protein Aco04nite_29270 [Actinoplanes consettensis]